MARVNITIPDDVLARARAAGMNVSQLATGALAEELERRTKVETLRRHLAELDARLGPVSDAERAEAEQWADQLLAAARVAAAGPSAA